MDKFTIIFMGLIAQIGLGSGEQPRAVYVRSDDPPHQAVLVVHKDDLDPNFKPVPKEIKTGCPVDHKCFSLDRWRLTLSGVPGGQPSIAPTFTKYVPHLRTAAKPKTGTTLELKPSIAAGEYGPAIRGLLNYGGGSLKVDRVWCDQVRLELKSDGTQLSAPMCVAHHVIYESGKPTGDYVEFLMRLSHKPAIRIKSSATVTIRNMTDATTKKHYQKHANLLDNADEAALMIATQVDDACKGESGLEDCVLGTPGPMGHSHVPRPASNPGSMPSGPRSVDYECTGSQWP